jgi:hypothetical protein
LHRPARLQRARAPDDSEMEDLVHLISQRADRCLERLGLLEQDAENTWLELEPADDTDALPHIMGSSISSATAPALLYLLHPCSRVGLLSAHSKAKKAFMICTIRSLDRPDPGLERVTKANGFSLYAVLGSVAEHWW